MEACTGGRPWCYSLCGGVGTSVLTPVVLKVWKGRSKVRLHGALPVTTKTVPPSYGQVTKDLLVPESVREC
mgnify:CR=1 FL=1